MTGARRPFTIFVLAVIISGAQLIAAPPEGPEIIGEHLRYTVLQTPHPYPAGTGNGPQLVWTDHFSHPTAMYLVLEFKIFDLAPGDWVEIRDPDRKQVHIYTGKGFKDKGGNFISKMILGNEATIDLYSVNSEHASYGYRVERISRGYDDVELAALQVGTEAICGVDDKEDAICYETSFPDVSDRARAVARIVMDGSALCTGWLVSCQNHLITNNHCTWDDSDFDTQGELDRMEWQFIYQDATCGGGSPTVEYSFMGGTWLENNRNLDYTLIQAPAGEDPASTYDWLLIDYRLPAINELMYIVGHPSGRPKEISLYSTDATDQDNPDGFCEVFSTNEPACVGGSVPEIGYFCDTEGGNSGSPVLSRDTDRVIALHHCANCPNRGVRIQNIWDANQTGSFPLPSCSINDEIGSVTLDRAGYGCSDTIAIEVVDGSLTGSGSVGVTIWSDTETTPEALTLLETPANSATFIGVMNTSTVAAANGDSLLSLADGDLITARYVDADDGTGGTNINRDATAAADCTPPVISNVQAINVAGSLATITWDTNENAGSEVSYSTSPPAWSTTSDGALVTSHSVDLKGLSQCSNYSYWVKSADEAGNSASEDNGGSYYQFTTGSDATASFPSTDTPIGIVDLASVVSTLNVADSRIVQDMNVTLNITHTYDADLDIFLKAPNGVEIELSSDNGGSANNYSGTIIDDEASTPIAAGSAPFTGSFSPEQPLSTFDGLSAAGNWELRVFDDASQDTGTLDSWSLTITFPPQSCVPNARYVAHTPVTDTCSLGGIGNLDSVWDPGEAIEMDVTLENDGSDPLTNVQGTISSLTPGVTVVVGSQPFGNLAAGAVASSSTPFQVQLPDNLACGGNVDFQLDIVSLEGSWIETFAHAVGQIAPGGGTALNENFDAAGIPGNWTVVDGGAGADTWFSDDPTDPAGCGTPDPNPPMGGTWATVDSNCAGNVLMDEQLITPVLDLSLASTVTLEFDHYFNIRMTEKAELDVRSSLTGGSWVNVQAWLVNTANATHEVFDITAQAAGASDVEIRWHYYDATNEWGWQLDNALVTFTGGPVCAVNTCATGSPPGEQTGLTWTGPDDLAWGQDLSATSGYTLYRGQGTDAPALMTSATDSCIRYTGAGTGDNAATVAGTNPAPGGVSWYLVTGWNGSGQGTSGDSSAQARIVNDTGACPP